MASAPLYIVLASGEHEKIQLAAMLASVGAVSERPVEVFVSMSAILAFARDTHGEERYRGGRFSALLKERQAPDALGLFRQGRALGSLKLWACSLALDLQGWQMADLAEDLFDGPRGLARFLGDAEAGQLVTI